MFSRPQRELISLALLLGLAVGCSGRTASVARSTDGTDGPATQANESPSEEGRDTAASKAANAQFKPPFPDRQELFLPPDQREQVSAPAAPKKNSSIQVKGFANADGMHALLVIDGRLTAMRVGESRGGIEVLSVKPPRVILRQDGQSWTESLSPNAHGTETEEAAPGPQNPQIR